jgi:hypothetical protein
LMTAAVFESVFGALAHSPASFRVHHDAFRDWITDRALAWRTEMTLIACTKAS